MRAGADGRIVVGKEQDAVALPHVVQSLQQGRKHLAVDQLNGAHLFLCVSRVAAFIGRFDVQRGKIILFEGIQRRLHLADIVGVDLARRTVHRRVLQSRQLRNARHQRHRRDRIAAVAVFLFKLVQLHSAALPPKPERIGRHLARSAALVVDGVLFENTPRCAHDFAQHFVALALGQVLRDGSGQNVVRRRGFHLVAAGFEHRDVAIGGIDGEAHAVFFQQRCKGRLCDQVVHQLHRVLPVDGAAAVGEHGLPFVFVPVLGNRRQVAAEGDIALFHLHTGARSLQRGAAGIDQARVIAEDVQNGGIAARGHAARHGAHLAHQPLPCQAVNHRLFRRLQRSFAAQLFHREIRHAVADDQYIFHKLHALLCSRGIFMLS